MSVQDRAAARRLRRPSWRDPRLLVGLLLICASTVLGARVVTAADDTTPVYAASRPLVPGQPLDSAGLVAVRVDLGETGGRYLAADRPLPEGSVALREVRAGELVPVTGVGDNGAARQAPVMVPVDPDSASVLVAGSVVDVWVNPKQTGAGGDRFGVPRRTLTGVPVSRVPDPGAGRTSGLRQTVAIQLMVPSDSVEALVAAIDQGARITVVPVTGSLQRGS